MQWGEDSLKELVSHSGGPSTLVSRTGQLAPKCSQGLKSTLTCDLGTRECLLQKRSDLREDLVLEAFSMMPT